MSATSNIPRGEYPRPQFQRERWLCLNGVWQFEFDPGDSGFERGLLERPLARSILVPFCPESRLSGIGDTDFHPAVWYRREVLIPADWDGNRVMLHFGAVDYEATVWVNGQEVKRHRGGFTSFCCDLRDAVSPGQNAVIVVRARDYPREPKPSGKQSDKSSNYGCFYTRTTGIWQTVWLEPVPPVHFRRPRITPDVAGRRFVVEMPMSQSKPGFHVRAAVSWRGRELSVGAAECAHDLSPRVVLSLPENEVHLWGPGQPNLYDFDFRIFGPDGAVVDAISSYAGLRGIAIDGRKVLINGRPVFQRQILDQGYYPDGILTAPSDDALRHDIELAMQAGFNCARLHEKVFEERFLYHADRLGYLVWGEFANWGMWGIDRRCSPYYHHAYAAAMTQWLEALERDYSHPSIIGWCGLNEEGRQKEDRMVALDDLQLGMFLAAKAIDPSRPALDVSGHVHAVRETDVYDVHDYEQDPEKLAANYARLAENRVPHEDPNATTSYQGQPFFVSEFGGIKWNPQSEANGAASWGYGSPPKTLEEFYARFEGLCHALMDNPNIFGFCYTQLTDTFQEQNGIAYFDRTPKFDPQRLRQILGRKAAIEK